MSSNNYLAYLFERIYNETGSTIIRADPDANKPPSKEHVRKGKEIADKAGLEYMGWWDDLNAWWFNDPTTHSTIIAKSVEEAIAKKEKLLSAYRKAHKEEPVGV